MTIKTRQTLLLLICIAIVLQVDASPANALANQENLANFIHLKDKQLDAIGLQSVSFQDEKGFMWFGGAQGLVRYDAYKFKLYQYDPDKPNSLSSNDVFTIASDTQQNIWVGTPNGASRYNPASDDFTRFAHDPLNTSSIRGSDISSILKDGRGHLWFGTNGGGLNRFLPNLEQFEHLELHANGETIDGVASIIEDRQGSLWMACTFDRWETFGLCALPRAESGSMKVNVSFYLYDAVKPKNVGYRDIQVYEDNDGQIWVTLTGGGFSHFNRVTTSFSHHRSPAKDNDKIHSIYENRFGDFWFRDSSAGLSIKNNYASAFLNYRRREEESAFGLSANSVNAVVETAEGNLWIGTEKGLNYIHRHSGEVKQYLHDPAKPLSPEGLAADSVLSLLIDSEGALWIGTWLGGLTRFDPSTGENVGTFTHFQLQSNRKNSLTDNAVLSLFEDSENTLWVGTRNGLSQFQRESSTFLRYEYDDSMPKNIVPDSVLSMFEDSRGNFLLGSATGLLLMDREAGTFKRYQHNNAVNTIDTGHINAIHEDKKGQLWLAIAGCGLNVLDLDSDKAIKKFNVKDGLPDSTVKSIQEDNAGSLWLSTGYGLSNFQPSESSFRNYTDDHGLVGNKFNRASYLKTKRGELAFGSRHGLTLFNPEDVFKNTFVPPIVITDFHLFHEPVKIGGEDSPLQLSITSMAQSDENLLTLSHKQSVFSFEFAALNYQLSHLNQYAYKLEGFDKHWVQSGTKRRATYTNLDPGSYVFRVKGSNSDDLWSEVGAEINIQVIPPWWRTWWAISLYVLSFLFLFGVAIYYYLQRKQAKVEQHVIEKLRHLDRIKDTFLVNTSHELRTPLNGIIGLSDSLIDGVAGPLPQDAKDHLHMIVNSSKRLSHLINDIMDFTQLKQDAIDLDLEALNLHRQTSIVTEIVEDLIGNKPVQLFNQVDRTLPSVLADNNRVQQILYNLISNAIKFTEKGSVTVSGILGESFLWISVADTGVGIDSAQNANIFDAFDQADDPKGVRCSGTGLSLSVTKQLVELHGGQIKMDSEVGVGSTFRFSLPLTNAESFMYPRDETKK